MRTALIIILLLGASAAIFFFTNQQKAKQIFNSPVNTVTNMMSHDSPFEDIKEPEPIIVPESYLIDLPTHMYQTFNNCGPATLTMVLNYFGETVTQKQLGDILRPYQVASGDNDDKSVSLEEMAAEAEKRGYLAYHRPNGTIDILKKLTSNDIPVIVETWLAPNDDVGHYRVVTGYNESTQQIIQDDSYQGPDKYYDYEVFENLWQGFHYQYFVVVEPDKKDLVEQILANEVDKNIAWKNTIERAEQEKIPGNPYPIFNQSIANYHLGNYQESVDLFEMVENQLPGRMLWYETEPILAYKEVGNYDRAFQLIDEILNGGNRAAAELYQIKGDIYKEQGNEEQAKIEYDLAKRYNKNLY